MSLANAKRSQTEVGKIRIGDRVAIESGPHKGDPRPNKLTHFRLTSNNLLMLQAAAQVYGGEAREWVIPREWAGKGTPPEHKYELYTEADVLRVVLRANQMLDTWRERWEGGWCTRRCDSEVICFDAYDKTKVGHPCDCPVDHEERKALAVKGKGCQEVSRLLVQIFDMPYGYWRLDTKGIFGPAEMRELQDFLQVMQLGARPVEAMLRLETRTARRIKDGQRVTHTFQTVVLEPIYTAAQLALAAGRTTGPIALLTEGEQAALAADEVFGDGAGDNLRQHMQRQEAQAPIEVPATPVSPPTPNPRTPAPPQPSPHTKATSDDLPAVSALLDKIVRLVRSSGRDLELYWQSIQKRFKVSAPEQLTSSQCETLHGECELYLKQVEQRKQNQTKPRAASAKPSPPPTTTRQDPPPAGAPTSGPTHAAPGSPSQPEEAPWRAELEALLPSVDEMFLANEIRAALTDEAFDLWKGEELLEKVQRWLQDKAQATMEDDDIPEPGER